MTNALTLVHQHRVNCIKTPVTLTNIFNGKQINSLGIWDTGATNSVITKSAASMLGLKPVGRATVRGVNGENDVNVYVLKIELNNKQITLTTRVTECEELSADCGICMLIDMDIITMGDFVITNFENKTTMSFICPSQKSIDYVEELEEYKRIVAIHESRMRQGNNICPCGSGKKFDNCHGKIKYK